MKSHFSSHISLKGNLSNKDVIRLLKRLWLNQKTIIKLSRDKTDNIHIALAL